MSNHPSDSADDPDRFQEVRVRLVRWFSDNRRDLPWRKTTDPYRILVSEIMLQQTRVETVLPYYARFLERFPTLQDLALAPEEDVLKIWSGLGYYRRARSLHRAARLILEEHDGVFPKNRADVLKLPGVGPYTAGAVLSIAFGVREPVVDGNVERVLARFFGIRENPAFSAGKKRVWETASRLVPPERPGDFNQALMELGALVCVPVSPDCSACPLSDLCYARSKQCVGELPLKEPTRKTTGVEEAVLLVRSGNRMLLTNRNEESLYDGLWQFPWVWKKKERSLETAALKLARKVWVGDSTLEEVFRTAHTVTYRRVRTVFYRLSCGDGGLPSHREGFKWADIEELQNEALPGYQKRVLLEISEMGRPVDTFHEPPERNTST